MNNILTSEEIKYKATQQGLNTDLLYFNNPNIKLLNLIYDGLVWAKEKYNIDFKNLNQERYRLTQTAVCCRFNLKYYIDESIDLYNLKIINNYYFLKYGLSPSKKLLFEKKDYEEMNKVARSKKDVINYAVKNKIKLNNINQIEPIENDRTQNSNNLEMQIVNKDNTYTIDFDLKEDIPKSELTSLKEENTSSNNNLLFVNKEVSNLNLNNKINNNLLNKENIIEESGLVDELELGDNLVYDLKKDYLIFLNNFNEINLSDANFKSKAINWVEANENFNFYQKQVFINTINDEIELNIYFNVDLNLHNLKAIYLNRYNYFIFNNNIDYRVKLLLTEVFNSVPLNNNKIITSLIKFDWRQLAEIIGIYKNCDPVVKIQLIWECLKVIGNNIEINFNIIRQIRLALEEGVSKDKIDIKIYNTVNSLYNNRISKDWDEQEQEKSKDNDVYNDDLIFNMKYMQYCDYLKSKYGPVEDDYYILANNKYEDNKNIKRASAGLIIHHIKESEIESLSSKKKDINKLYLKKNEKSEDEQKKLEKLLDCQKANNLVYCDIFEHFVLHFKIYQLVKSNDNPKVANDTKLYENIIYKIAELNNCLLQNLFTNNYFWSPNDFWYDDYKNKYFYLANEIENKYIIFLKKIKQYILENKDSLNDKVSIFLKSVFLNEPCYDKATEKYKKINSVQIIEGKTLNLDFLKELAKIINLTINNTI